MKIIIDFIYRIFGLVFFLSFVVAIISMFISKRVTIWGHSFNVPAFFISLFFISLFFIITLRPSWKQQSKTIREWKKLLASFLIMFFAIVTSYFGIYLPFNSILLADIPQNLIGNNSPFVLKIDTDKTYFIETDSIYRLEGSEIKLEFVKDDGSWSESFTAIVGKKTNRQDKASFGTNIVTIPITFPDSGVYKLFITNNSGLVEQVRIFQLLP